ncbi:SGNH/GDSL hydrolase family protein [Qingshengfaniella alkalisoli]|uniref:Arylesterase n=1 Tax=Qingshengfaniella alkalisoli TaxID=2599296 RepID=A0A5B8ICK7_9RHOB|nr:SGNH/GDSL hydrolase family protein [Qingshengfaniella alkalisoli]QDY71336.1 arylesterase [Qingshengfaniella alkalisoli]
MTKTILAFGDSLTWGSDPEGRGRHDFADRWPSVLQAGLGEGYHVIPEGLGGRTTAFDDYTSAVDLNGARVLPTLLATHSPLDLVIIMLGTNDLKGFISPTIHGAVAGMGRLVEIIRHFPYRYRMAVPEVLLVAPPHLCDCANGDSPLSGRSIAESRKLAPAYLSLAELEGCGFFDAATVAEASSADGVHLDPVNTRAIGSGLVAPVRTILS